MDTKNNYTILFLSVYDILYNIYSLPFDVVLN